MLRPILLIEDNPNDIELTMIALQKTQISNPVVSMRDGAEALEYLRRQGKWASRPDQNPAVILLDKKLPKVDGHEVLKAVRADPKLVLSKAVSLGWFGLLVNLDNGPKSSASTPTWSSRCSSTTSWPRSRIWACSGRGSTSHRLTRSEAATPRYR